MKIKMIPLSQLARSPDNVRKTDVKQAVESLAASIRVHGLLQNLQVRETAKDSYEVLAGAQRLAALKLLVKRKVLENDTKIACNVIDGQDGREISLAENEVRTPMHPADQFEAFKALAEDGKEPEDIAARFGVTAAVVRQRLKLASVSPKLVKIYRGDQMKLDQLMAFTVSDDHAAQEEAWFNVSDYNRNPADIRRRLTAAHIPATAKRAGFVGIAAYEAAGGGVIRVLFDRENEGYLTDAALLDRLGAEKIERDAEAIREEGWKWVEIIPDCLWDDIRKFDKVPGNPQPLSKKEAAACADRTLGMRGERQLAVRPQRGCGNVSGRLGCRAFRGSEPETQASGSDFAGARSSARLQTRVSRVLHTWTCGKAKAKPASSLRRTVVHRSER